MGAEVVLFGIIFGFLLLAFLIIALHLSLRGSIDDLTESVGWKNIT